MPRTKNPDYINWARSQAKKIIMDDLENDILPVEDDVITAEIAWAHYSKMPEFIKEKVVFRQFKGALKHHRNAIGKKKRHFKDQLLALEHDTQFMQHEAHDKRGKGVFHGTRAHALLKQDIQDEKHLTLGVEDLYYSRDEYCLEEDSWTLAFFRRRVRQEAATQKFHHYMEVKRAKKAEKNTEKAIKEAKKLAEHMDYYDINQWVDKDDVDDEDE